MTFGACALSNTAAHAAVSDRQIRMAPDHRIGVIVLVNRTGGTLKKTVERAFELMLPMHLPVAASEPEPQPVNMTEAEMTRYIGTYGSDTNRIELSISNGKLWFKRSTREGMVNKVADGRFLAAGAGTSAPLEFVLVPEKDGKTEFLHIGGRTYKKAE